MKVEGLIAVLSSIVVVALVTTLVLPGRQTPQVLTAGGNAFAGSLRAALGQK